MRPGEIVEGVTYEGRRGARHVDCVFLAYGSDSSTGVMRVSYRYGVFSEGHKSCDLKSFARWALRRVDKDTSA